MMEAERYPTDYDGIIAGDPNMDYHAALLRFVVQKAALASPASYLSPETLRTVDKAVTARCDMLDGAADGLIQDPTRCHVQADELVCHGGQTADCISADQSRVLQAYISGVRDRHGHLLYPGMPISNLSGPRGISYWTTGETAPDLAHADAPWGADANAPRGWVFARQALTYWLGMGADQQMAKLDVDPHNGTVGDALVAMTERSFQGGETKDPAKLLPFIRQGRKLIIYHGTSDPALSPYRSIAFYRDLAAKCTASTWRRLACACSLCPACSIAAAVQARTSLTRCRLSRPGWNRPRRRTRSLRPPGPTARRHTACHCAPIRSRRVTRGAAQRPMQQTGDARRRATRRRMPGMPHTQDRPAPLLLDLHQCLARFVRR